MRKPTVIGNWKMNGSRDGVRSLVEALVAQQSSCEAVICPPFVFLEQVSEMIAGSELRLGAQNVDWHESGAYTGEVSTAMLLEFGCEYCIIGHSERRAIFGETDQQVASKFAACHKAGLRPVLCVGESREQRLAGDTEAVVERQLSAVLEFSGIASFAEAVIAYEPVWAIGTGETASPEQAESVHVTIRSMLARLDARVSENIEILYGGSVNDENAAELFEMQNVDGALVGGASLRAEAFGSICRFAHESGRTQ